MVALPVSVSPILVAMRPPLRHAALVVVLALVAAASGEAQRRGGGRGFTLEFATADDFDGRFQFCRVAFRQNRAGDGANWAVDYPRADINLSIRLSELTKTTVSFDGPQQPRHAVVRLTDEALFQCPFVMMTEVGAAYLDEAEAAALRTYVDKGGFLWADDFWGEYAWQVWAEQLAKALPPAQYPMVDLPPDHPLFRAQFIMNGVPQIASIGHWFNSGGGTSERGQDSAVPHARVITDGQGRILVLNTHNTDLGDSWEEEASNPQHFYEMSSKGYAFGVNVLVYAMSH